MTPTKLHTASQISRSDILFGVARRSDSSELIVGSSDFHVYELDVSQEKPEGKALAEHGSYVMGVALAGDVLVSGGWDQKLVWTDAKSGKRLDSAEAHSSRLRKVVASPDGKLVASIGDDMVCRVWDAKTRKLRHELKGHEQQTPDHYPSMLYAAAFSPDGRFLATGDKVGHVVVWDVKNGKSAATLEAPVNYTWDPTQRRHSIGGIRSLCFSPDGKFLAVGGMNKVSNIDHPDVPARLEVFDWQKGERTVELSLDKDLKGLIHCLAFHPKGEWLVGAGGGYGGLIAFFDIAAGKILHQEKSPMRVHDLTLSESADTIYGVGHNKIVVWDFKGN